VVVTWGATAREPEGPAGEKPFPVQAVALVLFQASLDD
jgi:hypothetical protein